MKSPSKKHDRAYTLIETMLYVAMLSGIMYSLLPFIRSVQELEMRILHEVELHYDAA